jgi:HPt (histidine-containing phosphotransfer) domain-containing protein
MAGRLQALRAYPLERSRRVISREAHTIKGTAATFGFRRLSELAKRLERDADNVSAAEFDDLASRLEAAFAEAQPLLPGPCNSSPVLATQEADRHHAALAQKEASR